MNFTPHNTWSFTSIQRYKVELLLCLTMTVLAAIYSVFPNLRESLQSIYFVPVVVSALLLGWKKSSAFTVVGVSLVLCVSCHTWTDHTPEEFLQLILWGCTLGTTGAVIGLIVSAKDKHVSKLLETQNSLALTDQLTQIANRRAFDAELRRRMAEVQRHDRRLSILMIDIDYFKNFNDQFGHSVGDVVLQTIARTIQNCLREADLVARFGGEEFAVLLPDTIIDEGFVVAERIRESVDLISEADVACPQKVSVSIGLTELDPSEDEQTVLERADIAMYAAKRNGRNQVFLSRFKKHESLPNHQSSEASTQVIHSIFDEAQAMPSDVDGVTGLTFLQVFDNELVRRIYESARYGLDLCLGLVEVRSSSDEDISKSDICAQLSNIGRIIKNSLRESDVVTWYSEMEFGILLPFTKLSDGQSVLRRLFFEINTDLMLEENSPFFHVQTIRIIQLKAGDTKKQALKDLRAAAPIDDAEIGSFWV